MRITQYCGFQNSVRVSHEFARLRLMIVESSSCTYVLGISFWTWSFTACDTLYIPVSNGRFYSVYSLSFA